MSAISTRETTLSNANDSNVPKPAVGPRLRMAFYCLLTLATLLAGNSAYLGAIRLLEWLGTADGAAADLQNGFYLWMVLAHISAGCIMLLPMLIFVAGHITRTFRSQNRLAVRLGYAVLTFVSLMVLSGVGLLRIAPQQVEHWIPRNAMYWIHVVAPVVAAWCYLLHRLAGPRLKWRQGVMCFASALVVGAAMMVIHFNDLMPGNGSQVRTRADFTPSLARTMTDSVIPAGQLMMDQYCLKCHPETHKSWSHSAHRFSSFNNPMYLASIRETREVALKRDGNVAAARWCAGCHDPVTLLSGAFDAPDFDDVNDPTAHAGITCTVCHSIQAINSPRGNADYLIAAPVHYPFTTSSNPILQYVNEQLIKGKPSFHKRTFLKPLHKTAEFCASCHKVHLPKELTHYREFLRGQNHYDSFLISGVSGHGARSAYFPMQAARNCATCHMPLAKSNELGAKPNGSGGELSIHDHLFPGANTALPFLFGDEPSVKRHQEFLGEAARIDIFALRAGGTIDGEVVFPLRENIPFKDANRKGDQREFSKLKAAAKKLPVLKPGGKYLLDVVVRNLQTGHHLTQGTSDSNQVWMEVIAWSGNRTLGRSGTMDDDNRVDPYAHFVNSYLIDREGRRIERRNPQDIFTPLYNHQIGPGSAEVVHYSLELPEMVDDLVTVEVRLLYRKFDSRFMQFVANSSRPGDPPLRGHQPGKAYRNILPVTVLATDRITFPVSGVSSEAPFQEYPISIDHLYQRWNDFGIALMREGAGHIPAEDVGMELRLAESVFADMEKRFGYVDAPLGLAKLYFAEGRIAEADFALQRAARIDKPLFFTEPVHAPWAISWVRGLIRSRQGNLDVGIGELQSAIGFSNDIVRQHGFDFSRDYVVLNQIGRMLIERAKLERGPENELARNTFLNQAIHTLRRTLEIDPENSVAHHNLSIAYRILGQDQVAADHRDRHRRYQRDDNAHDLARAKARLRDPAANHAAGRIVIYSLNRQNEFNNGALRRPIGDVPHRKVVGGQR